MKTLCWVLLVSAIGAVTSVAAREPSEREVLDGVRHKVVFAVTPAEDGRLARCELREVQNRDGSIETAFVPSEAFVAAACDVTLAAGAWVPQVGTDGTIQPVTEDCYWSEVVPDAPICRAELSYHFSEQIPNHIGKIVTFEMQADADGVLVGCAFAQAYELNANAEKIALVPHRIFVEDACRKFGSARWINGERAPHQSFYMPCRYVAELPARAFCEQKFGK